MQIKIIGCFDDIGYYLVEHFLNDGYEIIGVDDINNEKKEQYYLMLGRNASFSLYNYNEQDEPMNIEHVYDFNTNKQGLLYYKVGKRERISIDMNDIPISSFPQDRIDNSSKTIEKDILIKWLASLMDYSFLPTKITIFGENRDGIYILNE
ncbi:hypothetical protein ACLIA0_03745 [Bacillaceae bacterium W0354]